MKPLSRAQLRAALVKRRPEDHKGTFGHVLVVAGSRGMAGAGVLAVRAALRSGAGLVTAAVPAGIQSVVASQAPEALTLGLPETEGGWLGPGAAEALGRACAARPYTALALGPGISTHPDAALEVLEILRGLPLPAVIDADALNILSARGPDEARALMRARKSAAIVTPHPGEMARCLPAANQKALSEREGRARRLAEEWKATVVLKGHRSVIVGGARAAVNPTGATGLAKGGTGDILTGLIAGLWAQSLASGRVTQDAAFLAAALGAYLHGRAGDLAEKALTPRAMTAIDVLDYLPGAFRSL